MCNTKLQWYRIPNKGVITVNKHCDKPMTQVGNQDLCEQCGHTERTRTQQPRPTSSDTKKDNWALILFVLVGVALICAALALNCSTPYGIDDAHKDHMELYEWDIADDDSTEGGNL